MKHSKSFYFLRLFKTISFLYIFIVLCAFQGTSYRHLTSSIPLSIHLLEVDPQQCVIKLAHAHDQVIGRQSVEELAKAHNALAAINSGFFKIDPVWNGLPAGILKIQSLWYAWPTKPRGALGWKQNGEIALIDQLLCKASCTIRHLTFPVDGLNCPRKENETILFYPHFHSTTLTDNKGFEVIVQKNRFMAIKENGNSFIPADGFVLSFGSKLALNFWRTVAMGTPIHLTIQTIPQSSYTTSSMWETMTNIVGGTPVLIRAGKVIQDFSSEKTLSSFLYDFHARTAVGLLPNGHWILAVIDGKQPSLSKGMTIPELATFMHSLGCQEALNLDGGGSSTMVINNRVVNNPTGDEDEDNGLKKVRKVSDVILILDLL